jgi:hypothetical protein
METARRSFAVWWKRLRWPLWVATAISALGVVELFTEKPLPGWIGWTGAVTGTVAILLDRVAPQQSFAVPLFVGLGVNLFFWAMVLFAISRLVERLRRTRVVRS